MNYKYILFGFLTLVLNPLIAQTEIDLGTTVITEREVAVDLDVPWEIQWGADDHIWATERKGNVLHIDPVSGNVRVILDIQNKVHADLETGLLGMAFHPDFTNTPKLFLVYSIEDSDNYYLKLVSYDWDGNELSNEIQLLKILFPDPVWGSFGHHGSRIIISPDQKIFITVGDGGYKIKAQSFDELVGKVLRVNLDGSIPNDNPIPDSYIYSLGHRNPQGLAFRSDGVLYSSEHGANHSDELNVITPKSNYGWPHVEGACDKADEILFCDSVDVTLPITIWGSCIAISDILFYEHEAIPEWQGKILIAGMGGNDGNDPRIAVREINLDGLSTTLIGRYFTEYGRIRDFCINPKNGAIYFATNGVKYPSQGPNRIIEYRNLSYQPTSTINQAASDQFVEIFPTLISESSTLNVKVSDSFVGSSISIYAYSGQRIKNIKISSDEFSLNLADLINGSYFVKATNEFGTISKTFIIQ